MATWFRDTMKFSEHRQWIDHVCEETERDHVINTLALERQAVRIASKKSYVARSTGLLRLQDATINLVERELERARGCKAGYLRAVVSTTDVQHQAWGPVKDALDVVRLSLASQPKAIMM